MFLKHVNAVVEQNLNKMAQNKYKKRRKKKRHNEYILIGAPFSFPLYLKQFLL